MTNWDVLESRLARELVDSSIGEPVTFHESTGTEPDDDQNVRGVFSATPVEVDVAGVPISTQQPVLGVSPVDFQAVPGVDPPITPAPGDHFTVRGIRYRVVNVDASGDAWLRVFLHKVIQ